MLKTKKVLAMGLAVTMLAALVGCGSSKSPSTSSEVPTTKTQESSNADNSGTASEEVAEEAYVPTYPIVDEPITVKAVVVNQDMTNERILWQKLAELTNINVEFINVESEQLSVFMAGNEWPDFFLCSHMSNSMLNEYGCLGHKFVDYNDYKDIMPNLWNIFEEYPLALQSNTQTDGGIYALPRIEESVTATMARLHYRSDFLEENNIEVPTTPDEFYDVLVKCRDLNNGQAPLVQKIEANAYTTSILYPAFGNNPRPGLYSDNGIVRDDRVEQQYRDFLSYMNKLYEEGLLHQEYLTLDTNSMLSLVQDGSAIFFAECALSITEDMFPDGQLHIGTLSPLVANKGDSPRCLKPTVVKNENTFIINANSAYVEEICKLVDIAFATEEVQEGTGLYGLAFNYGPVGMCIHLNDDNTYDLTMPDGSDGFTAEWMYENVNYSMQGVMQLGEYITSTPGNNQERHRGFAENVIPYATMEVLPTYYFSFTGEEQAVIDQYSTEFNSFVSEMRNKFIMGVEDINDDATWEKYCSQMEAYGMNELVAVNQSAYERFMGN